MLKDDLAIFHSPLLPGESIRFKGDLDDDNHLHCGILSGNTHVIGYVEDGVASFVAPELNWANGGIDKLREDGAVRNCWDRWQTRNMEGTAYEGRTSEKMKELVDTLAEMNGTMLEIGAGPGGGLSPGVLLKNPDRRIVMNELSIGILHLHREQALEKSIGRNVMYVVYDATTRILRPSSVQAVSDWFGTGNTGDSVAGLKAAYEALEPGGYIVTLNGCRNAEEMARMPESFMNRWGKHIRQTYRPVLEEIGFIVETCEVLDEREQPPEDSGFSTEAFELGHTVSIAFECIEARKPEQSA